MTLKTIHLVSLAVLFALFFLGWTAPSNAAELPYRQMAVQSLHCHTINNKRRSKNCMQYATGPIHAACQRLRGLTRKSCFRKHSIKLRLAIANKLKKRNNK